MCVCMVQMELLHYKAQRVESTYAYIYTWGGGGWWLA